jgi:uncharacterized membrane protein
MSDLNPRSTLQIVGHPIHPMAVKFPIAFFIAAFVCDILFLRTGHAGWAVASQWLLGAGVAIALVAAAGGLIDFLGDRRIRALADAWRHMIGNVVLVAVEALNFYLRCRDGAAVISPYGVILSGIGVALLLFTAFMGGQLVFRHRVGVADRSEAP